MTLRVGVVYILIDFINVGHNDLIVKVKSHNAREGQKVLWIGLIADFGPYIG